MKKHLTCLLIALLISCLGTARGATEVITLNHRLAEELLPIAETVLGQQGRATPYGNQLIVNAPTAVIDELRHTLAQLDRPARQLLISVDTLENRSRQEQGYRVDGSISVGGVDIEANRGEIQGRDKVRIINSQTHQDDSGIQQVQTTEGYPALIQMGQQVPLRSQGVDAHGRPYHSTHYRTVSQGFYATATLVGDRVQIELSSQRDRLNQKYTQQSGRSNRNNPVIEVQSTETRISGRLGEWIAVGAIDQHNNAQRTGFLDQYQTQGNEQLSLRIKVEIID